jgi:hypothetical protein
LFALVRQLDLVVLKEKDGREIYGKPMVVASFFYSAILT